MVLESVLNKEESYYNTAVVELMKIVKSIYDKQKKPYNIFLNDIARRSKPVQGQHSKKPKEQDPFTERRRQNFFSQLMISIGASIGAAAGVVMGTIVGPAGSVAAGVAGGVMGGSLVGGAAALLGNKTKVNKCRTQ